MSLKRNAILNLVGTGTPLFVALFTIPFLLSRLGIEAFGILTLIWALIGYFSLFDFGLGRALTQQIAVMRAVGSIEEIPRRIKAGVIFTLWSGLLGGFLLAVLSHKLSYSWLNISDTLMRSAFLSFLTAAGGIPMATVTAGLRGALEGYEDFKAVNILRVVLGILNFGLPALSVIIFGSNLEYVVISLVISRIIVCVLHLILVNRSIGPQWLSEKFEFSDIKLLGKLGIWMTVSNIVSPLMVTADRFMISSVLGAVVVAYYSVPFEALFRILLLPGALSAALFPKIASLITIDLVAAKNIYLKSVSVVTAVLATISLILALSAHLWLSIWLGVDFADKSWIVASILAIGICFNGIAQIPYALIQAAGDARLTARIHFTELFFYIPILYLSIKYFGIAGAAGAWMFRVLADLLVLQFFAKKYFYK